MVVITNPLWVMKTRLQLQGQSEHFPKYSSFRDTIQTMIREEGYFGFYKGFIPSILLTSHGAVQVMKLIPFRRVFLITNSLRCMNN